MTTTTANGTMHYLRDDAAVDETRAPMAPVWWLDPTLLFMVVVGGTLAAAWAQSREAYDLYDTPKYVDNASLMLGLFACLMVACGVYFGLVVGEEPRAATPSMRRATVPWFYAAVGLTLFGYAAWFANGVRNGFSLGMFATMLRGADEGLADDLKFEIFKTIPGITTCTQFGLVAVLLGTWLYDTDGRYIKRLFFLMVALAAIRMVLVSERLALVEVGVLAGMMWLRTRMLRRPMTPTGGYRLAIAPVVGVVVLAVLMGATEYVRSWTVYRNQYHSVVSFTTARLNSYYATSHNNGAMAWTLGEEFPVPYYTLEWFWLFPLVKVSPLSYEGVSGIDPAEAHTAMLDRYGTRELNNPGGLFCPTLDFGIFGGAVFWLMFGMAAGRLYRGYQVRSLAGLMLYPFVILSILEVPRHLYMCSVRIVPALAMIVVMIYFVTRQSAPGHAD